MKTGGFQIELKGLYYRELLKVNVHISLLKIVNPSPYLIAL